MWKRRVVERCLYGIDVNPLSYELARLALWLSSASLSKPLAFLDHHLKIGNSLYSAPLKRLSALQKKYQHGPNNRFQDYYEQILKEAKEKFTNIINTDSDHIKQVKKKSDTNDSIKASTQYLRNLANVWLATLFEEYEDTSIDQRGYQHLLQESINSDIFEPRGKHVETHSLVHQAQEIAEKKHFFHWELEFPDAVVDGVCQFDVIITNPPYIGSRPTSEIQVLYQTAPCRDSYAWILEQSLCHLYQSSMIGMIVPLSLMFSKSFIVLRNLLLTKNLHLRLSSYDNIPDSLFNAGKISDNTNRENSQRTAIVLAQVTQKSTLIESTDLLRWRHEERNILFEKLHFIDTTAFCSKESFPRIGNDTLTYFWTQFKHAQHTVSEFCEEMFSEVKKPPSDALFLTMPRTVRYFISAIPGSMARDAVLSFSFKSQKDMDLIRVLLNSNIFYWYWRAFGDGFHLNLDLVGAFPVPDEPDNEYLGLAARLDAARNECATSKIVRGKMLINYNFNKRRDILLDIDEWVMRHVALDVHLPRDLFVQYKSNSYLHLYSSTKEVISVLEETDS